MICQKLQATLNECTHILHENFTFYQSSYVLCNTLETLAMFPIRRTREFLLAHSFASQTIVIKMHFKYVKILFPGN